MVQLADPPEDLQLTWNEDAVTVTIEPDVSRTWTLGAVVLETGLLWAAAVLALAVPAMMLAISTGLSAQEFLVMIASAYPLIAIVWVPWQLRNRSARMQIRIDRRAVSIQRLFHVLRRHRDIRLEDVKRVRVDPVQGALRIEKRSTKPLVLRIEGAKAAHLRWIASTIQRATDENARFWREELDRGAERQKVERLLQKNPPTR